jgi:uncharacterized membrane protein
MATATMGDRIRSITGGKGSVNVGANERKLSTYGGVGLVLYGLTRFSLGGLFLAMIGGVLMKRGITGECDVYRALDYSTSK